MTQRAQIDLDTDWVASLPRPLVIAGPCSAEHRDQVLDIARALKDVSGVSILRAPLWKPRTQPDHFEGVGEFGFRWLSAAREETGLAVTLEVSSVEHIRQALQNGIEILWIGARTTVNPFLVQELAEELRGRDVTILVKNPVNPDLKLWVGALERFSRCGLRKLIAVHRGFSTYSDTKYRNDPLWKVPINLRRLVPEIPIVCDPSHIAGDRELVPEVCYQAMDYGMDGLMVECHTDPVEAWSDAEQQVTPEVLQEILQEIDRRNSSLTGDGVSEESLQGLRDQIDQVDHDLLELLARRFDKAREIGKLKFERNMTLVQLKRFEALLRDRLDLGEDLGLQKEFLEAMFALIHEESLRRQSEYVSGRNQKVKDHEQGR